MVATVHYYILVIATSLLVAIEIAAARPPNIVFILADDLGWSDLGCFGSKYYRTPSLDLVASRGMRFTDAYSCGPNCAPTRACLMSGLYTPRHGVYTVNTGARGKEPFRKLIPVPNQTTLDLKYVTLPERLRAAGYITAHLGKWHLGKPPVAGPRQQGFDFNFAGNRTGSPAGGYFSPYRNPQLTDGAKGESLTDRLTDEAIGFIKTNQGQPFFVYLPYYAVHTPLQGKPHLVAQYRDRKPVGGHGNPDYAAMIETLDAGVGRIAETLDDLGLAKDTILIFTSDNGGVGGYGDLGSRNITSNAPLRGGKGMLYEGGIRVPLIVCWPGVVKPESTSDTPVSTVDFLPSLTQLAGCPMDPSELADGVDFGSVWRGGSIARDALYWHFPGYLQAHVQRGTWRTTPAGAIRAGDFKLIEFFEDNRRELYHLRDDPSESNDLSELLPDKTNDLHKRLVAWRKRVGAPLPTPKRGKDSHQ